MTPQKAINILRSGFVAIPLLGLILGLTALWYGNATAASVLWVAATLPVLAKLCAEIWVSLHRGDYGLDIIAALSMTAALVFGEHLAAAVVALMYAGGQYLDAYAAHRARREMTALLSRVPRTALRHLNGELEEVALDDVIPGDRILVRNGDIVPTDGTVSEGVAVLDQAALTGESLPARHSVGEAVMSGVTNVGDPFDIVTTRKAADSTYAGIVRLVEQAQKSKAPMTRLADQFAIYFLFATLAIAGAAWGLSDDPIRAVAVLVVATPCPLILAVPVALVSGLSRAASHGILIKGTKVLELMSQVQTLVLDKTGTLTDGKAHIVATSATTEMGAQEMLRIAASLDQTSKHTIAQTLVAEARNHGLNLSIPKSVKETAGEGMEGVVDGRQVILGGRAFVANKIGIDPSNLTNSHETPGAISVAMAVDSQWVGELIFADGLRDGTDAFLKNIRDFGVRRIVLATGDRRDVAKEVVDGLDFDSINAELTPEQKIRVVLVERKNGPVMMIGDGVNDAPALSAADIGVAMGARGAAASAEAADVVLLVDRLDRIHSALKIARRSRNIALQSVYAGIGLSLLGMFAAAFGHITPVQGALLQEVIDVVVILNALRALQGNSITE